MEEYWSKKIIIFLNQNFALALTKCVHTIFTIIHNFSIEIMKMFGISWKSGTITRHCSPGSDSKQFTFFILGHQIFQDRGIIDKCVQCSGIKIDPINLDLHMKYIGICNIGQRFLPRVESKGHCRLILHSLLEVDFGHNVFACLLISLFWRWDYWKKNLHASGTPLSDFFSKTEKMRF